jgi:hypothetical protein
MRKINPSTFLVGFLMALLVAVAFWYYQKSTSAEDGAIDLLDRYAQAQARLKEMAAKLAEQQADGDQAAS